MNEIQNMIMSSLGNGGIQQFAAKLGIDPAQAEQHIGQALPMLMGGMQHQMSDPVKAAALHSEAVSNDGSILNDVDGHLSGFDPNSASPSNLLGDQADAAHQALAGQTGLNVGQAGNLMSMLGPMVMGAVGKQQSAQGLDQGGLANMLGGLNLGGQNFGQMLGMLDQNHDGNVVDDVTGMLGNLFGKK